MPTGLRVFILGPARSGTSAMFYAMHALIGLPGEGESHIMPGFQRVAFAFARYAEGFQGSDGVMANRLDPRAFRNLIVDHVRQVYQDIFPEGRFVDKTPGAEAIAGAPLIRECFPEARIIVMRRSGIEVVQSHVKKFRVGFEEACQAWAASMGAIRQIRRTSSDVLELEHFELVSTPEAAAARVAAYLGLSEKMAELTTFFENNKTDRASDHEWGTRLLLKDVAWSAEERETFLKICGSHMEALEYPM